MTVEFVAGDRDNAHPVNAIDLASVHLLTDLHSKTSYELLQIGVQREYSNTSTNHPSTNKYTQLNTNHKIQFILSMKLLHV